LVSGRRAESGQAIVLLLILLALAGGGWWMLHSARATREKEAREFATEVATRVVLQRDLGFLNLRIAPEAQREYPPSWRERLLYRIREVGDPVPKIQLTGQVQFTRRFFEPKGHFRAQIDFYSGPGYLDMVVSHPKAIWQIDALNWTWVPPGLERGSTER
jgi:hypothetical protein